VVKLTFSIFFVYATVLSQEETHATAVGKADKGFAFNKW